MAVETVKVTRKVARSARCLQPAVRLGNARPAGGTLIQAIGVPMDVIDRRKNLELPGSNVRCHCLLYDHGFEKREARHRHRQHL
jgi:hypothetical protein